MVDISREEAFYELASGHLVSKFIRLLTKESKPKEAVELAERYAHYKEKKKGLESKEVWRAKEIQFEALLLNGMEQQAIKLA